MQTVSPTAHTRQDSAAVARLAALLARLTIAYMANRRAETLKIE